MKIVAPMMYSPSPLPAWRWDDVSCVNEICAETYLGDNVEHRRSLSGFIRPTSMDQVPHLIIRCQVGMFFHRWELAAGHPYKNRRRDLVGPKGVTSGQDLQSSCHLSVSNTTAGRTIRTTLPKPKTSLSSDGGLPIRVSND
jgi:hypothetical protein